MASLTVYSLKSCDTCRGALAALRAAGHEPQVIDIRTDGVPGEVLAALVAGQGPEVLVNRRSTTWRSLDEATRNRAMDPGTAAAVLAGHPTLMKRPVVVAGGVVHVGWGETVRQSVLG